VKIEPSTAAIQALLADKVTVALDAITDAGFTSALTWDSAVAGDPSTGNLQYDAASGLWKATATFSGLPAVPANSWGRVPKNLRDLLYGARSAVVTVANPSGGGNLCVDTEAYEVYFGDSLVIDGKKMAETTENYTDHIQALVAAGGVRREIYEKMNCSTETFTFTDDSKASQNFTMRNKAVEIMNAMNTGTMDVGYYNASATPPVYPRAGNTFYDTAASSWSVGTYWRPADIGDPWSWVFLQKAGTSAHNAINNVTPFRGECAAALEICVFQAADHAIGAAEFNTIHPAGSLGLGNWGGDFGTHCAAATDMETLVPGDYVYMKNKDDYLTWAPDGYWQGENCICMGENAAKEATFGGLGENKKTEAELRAALKAAYEADCAPHTVTDPDTQIRFTTRSRTITGN
jgi:hypothetical protein